MTVLYAAFVSVVVTLTIEWFAKPWLEARKERVLEQQRTLHAILNMAHEHVWKAERITVFKDTDVSFKDQKDEFIRLRSVMPLPKNNANREALMLLTDLMEGSSKYIRVGGDYELLWACADILGTPRWNPLARRKHIKRMGKELQNCIEMLDSIRVKNDPPSFGPDEIFRSEPKDGT